MVGERITVDPAVCGGKPCIRGTRVMVKNILGLMAGGYSLNQILETYSQLSADDVVDALAAEGADSGGRGGLIGGCGHLARRSSIVG